jgi:hypothetical protein
VTFFRATNAQLRRPDGNLGERLSFDGGATDKENTPMRMLILAISLVTASSVAMAQPAPPPPGGPHHPPPPPPEKGAHIRLKQGEAAVDLKCPDETPLKDCADLAMRLLDRVSGPKPAEPPR